MGRDTIKGSPQAPLSSDELVSKFRSCLEFGLGAPASAASGLAQLIRDLECSTDAACDIVAAFPSHDGS